MTRRLAKTKLTPEDGQRFWSRLGMGAPDECWEWRWASRPSGYGVFVVQGKNLSTHRVAWELTSGESAEGLVVMHSCDNPPCCNPEHLRAGTQKENVADAFNKGRRMVGERHHNAVLTEDDVIAIRILYRHQVPVAELAARYGIGECSMIRAIRGITWGHVPDPVDGASQRGKGAAGEDNGMAVLTKDDVLEIRWLSDAGVDRKQLQTRFGVSKTLIARIVRGDAWRHLL